MDNEKVLIPVIGMHRSGTSAVAGALLKLGIDFGHPDSLMRANHANPRGYFESLEVVGIHDALLHNLDCCWNDVQLRGDWMLTRAADVATQSARNWLSRLNGLGPFGVKDPRMTLFPQVWFAAAKMVGVELRPLIVMRNQNAIAHSLARRDGMSGEHVRDLMVVYGAGAWMWWTDVSPLAATRICFENLMENPGAELVQTMSNLGFPPPFDNETDPRLLQPALDFLDESLVHG